VTGEPFSVQRLAFSVWRSAFRGFAFQSRANRFADNLRDMFFINLK